MSKSAKETYQEYFEKNKDALLEEFFTLLRFESISTLPEHKEDVTSCSEWVANYLEKIGLTVQVWKEQDSHPVVFAEWMNAGADKPTALLYAHYDVQPVDPVELWNNPPFEPTLKDGEVYARGAQDDKGQTYYTLAALKAMLELEGGLPINIKVLIEGEEECGSTYLSQIADSKKKELNADYFLVVDAGFVKKNQPAVTLGMRGILGMEVEVTGSTTDLHSGVYGGVAYNANHALVELVAKLRDANGKIAVPGFYDNMVELSQEERDELCFDFDIDEFRTLFGAEATGGEKAFGPVESAWIRPTLEINGISGGYAGKGFKTVIPAKAIAKISCRLIPNQDPKRIFRLITEFLASNAPEGIDVDVRYMDSGAPLRTTTKSKVVQATAKAYEELYDTSCKFIHCGGSIPVATTIARAAGADTVFLGVALPGDNMHAPNEHFGVDRLGQGLVSIALVLKRLAN